MTKNKPQGQKFIETAKELDCDESEAAFNEKLEKLAKPEDAKAQKNEKRQ